MQEMVEGIVPGKMPTGGSLVARVMGLAGWRADRVGLMAQCRAVWGRLKARCW